MKEYRHILLFASILVTGIYESVHAEDYEWWTRETTPTIVSCPSYTG